MRFFEGVGFFLVDKRIAVIFEKIKKARRKLKSEHESLGLDKCCRGPQRAALILDKRIT